MVNSLGKAKFDDNTQFFGKTNDCFGSALSVLPESSQENQYLGLSETTLMLISN